MTDDERQAFDAFAVFAGGADLRAAEAVRGAAAETLEALVSKSLLARRGERLTMLETMRALAAERLGDDTRRRHVRHYAALADEADGHMFGPRRRATAGPCKGAAGARVEQPEDRAGGELGEVDVSRSPSSLRWHA